MRGEEVRTLRNAVLSEKNSRIVVIDLSDVEIAGCGGLTALLSLHQWARSRGVQLKLVNPSHFVHEVLTRTRLNHVFDISSWSMRLFVLRGAPDCHHARYAAAC